MYVSLLVYKVYVDQQAKKYYQSISNPGWLGDHPHTPQAVDHRKSMICLAEVWTQQCHVDLL